MVMSEKITGLEPGMKFGQVVATVGQAAIFRVDGMRTFEVWGETLTEPPLA